MLSSKQFIVSHAPFWHNGTAVHYRNYNWLLALAPAVAAGLTYFGVPALGVICLAVSSAILWEGLITKLSGRQVNVGDGNAALVGLIFGLLLPATAPWWLVLSGTLIAILIGQQVFGGIGGNPFNPAALSWAIIFLSWKTFLDFDSMLANYSFNFTPYHPLVALKAFGPQAVAQIPLLDLFLGKQVGGIGTTCGLALVTGGIWLIARGIVRWEIPVSFLAGVLVSSLIFYVAAPAKFAGPGFHILAGYTLFGAFFLAPEDSSSPVNFVPMLIYGATGGIMTILIRNIGAYPDGVIFAVLVINLINPLIDKIRPQRVN